MFLLFFPTNKKYTRTVTLISMFGLFQFSIITVDFFGTTERSRRA